MKELEINHLKIRLYTPKKADALFYILKPEDVRDNASELMEKYGIALACIEGFDWNHDLCPWAAPAVFKGEEDFSGGGDDFLEILKKKVLPAVESESGYTGEKRYMAGISLAGMFSLYSLYKTDLFHGAASVSGSLWFDGFLEFMKNNQISKQAEKVYLSLGDKEKKARNPRMAKVEEYTLETEKLLSAKGIRTVFQLNRGNHFSDGEERIKKAVHWMMTGESAEI